MAAAAKFVGTPGRINVTASSNLPGDIIQHPSGLVGLFDGHTVPANGDTISISLDNTIEVQVAALSTLTGVTGEPVGYDTSARQIVSATSADSNFICGFLTEAKTNGQTTAKIILASQTAANGGSVAHTKRVRTTIANVNAGATLLPAVTGYKYRVSDIIMIAVGGAVQTATTIDILGTQATASVKLLAVAVAALTQSAVVRAGATNATVLADGASFAECDENTAITIGKTGSSAATATNVDVIISYELIAA